MTKQIAVATLLVITAAAFVNSGPSASRVDPSPVAPKPIAYRRGIALAERGSWISRMRVPVTFAILSMSSRKRLKAEAFEKVPLEAGQIEVTRISGDTLPRG